jgi:hypothetical protein
MQVAGDIYRRRGFQQAHILAHWPAIVGDMLAEFSSPEKLSFPRATGDTASESHEGGLLTIRVDGPAALELKHLEPQILERINGFYGHRAVARLRLIQGPLPYKRKSNRRHFVPLDAAALAALAQSLESIEEPALKGSLAKLGERVFASRKR